MTSHDAPADRQRRVAFAGTAPFAAGILARLIEHHPVELVISQPDRPAGRGRTMRSPIVVEAARQRGLPVIQPERLHDEQPLAELRSRQVDTIVVAAFGQMIREPVLSEFLMLNVHGSLLPEYRGAAPVERAIMDGRSATGVCIMQMEAGLDTGPVAEAVEVPIGSADDAGSVFRELEIAGAAALLRALQRASSGELTFVEQRHDDATYAHKITATDRALDPGAMTARQIHDRVRALSPHIGARLSIDGEVVTIWRTEEWTQPLPPTAAGTIMVEGAACLLATCDGVVRVVEVQPPGKRRMAVEDWLRGKSSAPSSASSPLAGQ